MQTSCSSYSLNQPERKQRKKQPHPKIKYILDDKSLTFAEKLISMKNVEIQNEKSRTISMSGDIVTVDVDLAMAQDSTGPLAIRSINEMGIDKVYDLKGLVGY
jgi:hypothetical protein